MRAEKSGIAAEGCARWVVGPPTSSRVAPTSLRRRWPLRDIFRCLVKTGSEVRFDQGEHCPPVAHGGGDAEALVAGAPWRSRPWEQDVDFERDVRRHLGCPMDSSSAPPLMSEVFARSAFGSCCLFCAVYACLYALYALSSLDTEEPLRPPHTEALHEEPSGHNRELPGSLPGPSRWRKRPVRIMARGHNKTSCTCTYM